MKTAKEWSYWYARGELGRQAETREETRKGVKELVELVQREAAEEMRDRCVSSLIQAVARMPHGEPEQEAGKRHIETLRAMPDLGDVEAEVRLP